jgi:hypothetical protein
MSRRDLIKRASATAATAALVSAVRASFPSGAFAQGPGLEKDRLKLGFIKLTDMAPLAVAREKGFFEEEGLEAALEAQANWKVILDRTLPVPGEARPDWWILSQVARRLGFGECFAYASPADIFDEHARLSGFANDGRRAFDISGAAGLDRHAYDAMQPFQWPHRRGGAPTERLFADGGFFTPDRKARLVAIAPPRLATATSHEWPFVLNTGRIRDRWHTVTRTGLSPRLSTHIAEPYVEIHPDDAARLGLEQGTLARLSTRHGTAILRVLVHRGRSGACCSCRSTGRPRTARARASARWCRRPTTPFPASRSPRRRPRISPRLRCTDTASASRAGRCGRPASPTGRRRARRSGIC